MDAMLTGTMKEAGNEDESEKGNRRAADICHDGWNYRDGRLWTDRNRQRRNGWRHSRRK